MKKSNKFFFIALLAIFVFNTNAQCKTGYGILNIRTEWSNIPIYVDEKLKVRTGEDKTIIKLEEGKHTISTYIPYDEDWYYKDEIIVYIGADTEITKTINPLKYPSEKRLQKISQNQDSFYTLGVWTLRIENFSTTKQAYDQALRKYIRIKKSKNNKFEYKLKGFINELNLNQDILNQVMASDINTINKPMRGKNNFYIIKILDIKK